MKKIPFDLTTWLADKSQKVVGEEWKPVIGFDKEFDEMLEVSNFGRVRLAKATQKYPIGHFVKQTLTKQGYYRITFDKNRRRKSIGVHRLVALAFIKNPYNKPHVDHIDGSRDNNSVSNLRWCTHQENCNYPIAQERHRSSHRNMRPVAQYTMDGIKIAEYRSISEASRKTGINDACIDYCALHRPKQSHAGGYKWEFIN